VYACGHFTLDTSDIFSAARADAPVRRNEHVRHCSILYYLEDGSIQVSACKETTKFEQTPSHAISPCATAVKYCYLARISKVVQPGVLHMIQLILLMRDWTVLGGRKTTRQQRHDAGTADQTHAYSKASL